MQILRSIKNRWSPRAFSEESVPNEHLQLMFEAARWAPSSMNEQPWRFVVARKEEGAAWERMFASLMDGNKIWAEKAPVLIAVLAKKNFDRNGRPNRHAWFDAGQAVANMITQATDLGLVAHQMGGFESDLARNNLAVPNEYDIVAIIAVGFIGDKDLLPEKLKAREEAPRKRLPLEEIVHEGHFRPDHQTAIT